MSQTTTDMRVREILGDDYLDLHVVEYGFEENVDSGACQVRCSLRGTGEEVRVVRGEGVGFVDAVFHAFRDAYAEDFPSLSSIRFAGFTVQADFDTRKSQTGSDAMGRVVLTVRNSAGRPFEFADSSRSITLSALCCTIRATEYFVNTERAFLKMHRALEDARARNRSDLAERFGLMLAELVENTSYSEAIEKARAADGA